MRRVPVADLPEYVGRHLGHSGWLLIDQARIDLFANATGDHQFIHVDPVRAAATPFGGTIAHGFLLLSLMPQLLAEVMVVPEGLNMTVNYGVEHVRFLQPVPAGSQVRLAAELLEAREKHPGQWLLRARAILEIAGREKPACVAELLSLCFI